MHNLFVTKGPLDINDLTKCHIGVIKTYTNIFNAFTLSFTKGYTGHVGKGRPPQDVKNTYMFSCLLATDHGVTIHRIFQECKYKW
jgi:hypothetical protein